MKMEKVESTMCYLKKKIDIKLHNLNIYS